MLASYLLWRRNLDEGLAKRIYATAFAATLAYFLLAYVDLATFEFAVKEGTPAWCTSYNLCGEGLPSLHYAEPHLLHSVGSVELGVAHPSNSPRRGGLHSRNP